MFDFLFKYLPYPIAAAVLRGIRTFITIVMAAALASLADGSLLTGVSIIPRGDIAFVTLILSPIFMGLDKWLRERGLETKDVPISLAGNGPSPTVVPPPVSTDTPTQ